MGGLLTIRLGLIINLTKIRVGGPLLGAFRRVFYARLRLDEIHPVGLMICEALPR